ncbi:MAG: [FeFe] hydrogenase H-cluster radical SAM maturase HydG [Deltaproteobacteria bacterium]|nr:[FeFe] hydrogenase H-cluster radical SAM maturase HydG [Deltaproteobacteria bacterium]
MNHEVDTPFIDERKIEEALTNKPAPSSSQVREIFAKAIELKGINANEVAILSQLCDRELISELFNTAKRVKTEIYGPRLVLFAPLYISNLCGNECTYCAFRASNRELMRRALTQEEIAAEVRVLINQGHKRVLLVAGESSPSEGFEYVLKAVKTIYEVKSNRGEIRRINVNVAPLSIEKFRELKAVNIGTYQVFQETYHRKTYSQVHTAGKKRDYDWRLFAMDRAMQAGINDVGIGPLLGLYDWRFEVLAMLQHIAHLEERFGVGPHTISVPRLEPAVGSEIAAKPPYALSDLDFCKLVAILRIAVPYTGIIMSTRESPEIRRTTFALGVSQISAGSRTNPAGYSEQRQEQAAQFQLGDHRSMAEVIQDVTKMGFTPSFCTACYRLGRTGRDFMDMAKPGEIKNHCDPNALSTYLEYLLDYGDTVMQNEGEKHIAASLERMDAQQRAISTRLLEAVRSGKRDEFV